MKPKRLQSVRGMRDFYPPDLLRRQSLFAIWRRIARSFGFSEYDAPIVESLDLLKRKAGEEITGQIYAFQDKSGRELALRPEMTPSLVRMVTSQLDVLPRPIKWFSIGQCFRYERMTTGRRREHFQLNLDVLGEPNQLAEAEVLAAAVEILRALRLTENEVTVKIGSRKILGDLLAGLGVAEADLGDVFSIIDKRGKISDGDLEKMLADQGMKPDQVKEIFRALAIRDFSRVKELLPSDNAGVREMEALLKAVKLFGIDQFVQFDLSVVRGLSYYTGTVFECFDKEAKFRAIFGGGRYDDLFQSMTGKSLPAVGLGFGDVVIDEVLRYYGKELPAVDAVDYVVAYTEAELEDKAIQLTRKLRKKGTVFLVYGPQRFKKALQMGDRLGAKQLALLDPREVSSGKYIVRDLQSGVQHKSDL